MSKEVMKLALEALNLVDLAFVCNGAHHSYNDRHLPSEDCPVTARYKLAIKSLEETLKKDHSEPVAVIGSGFQLLYCRHDWSKDLKVRDLLYTESKERKPLTLEQIEEQKPDWFQPDLKPETIFHRGIRAAEKAHKIS